MKPKAIEPMLIDTEVIETKAASQLLDFVGSSCSTVSNNNRTQQLKKTTLPPSTEASATRRSLFSYPYFKYAAILFALHAIYSTFWDPSIIQFFRKTAVGQLSKAVDALSSESHEQHLGLALLNLVRTFCFVVATVILHLACYAVLALLLLPLPKFLRNAKKIDANAKRKEQTIDVGVGITVTILSIVVVTFNTIIMRVGGDVFGMLRAESVFIETSFTDAFLVSWLPVAFRSILTAISLAIALLLFSIYCYKRTMNHEADSQQQQQHHPWFLERFTQKTDILEYGAKHPLLLKYAILLALFGCITFTSFLCKNFEHLPSVYSIPITLLYYYLFKLPTKVPKENLLLKPTQAPLANHIILIVDESIRAEYLSINNKLLKQDTTPFLKTLNPVNFGVSTSSFTCSCYSNYVIRNGVTLADIKSLYSMQELGNGANSNNVVDYSYQFSNNMHFDENLKKMLRRPSIFQYAANANLSTLMVNAQKKHGALHSFMHPTELQHIHDYRTTFFDNTRCSDHGDCTITSSIMSHLAPKANTSNNTPLNTFTLAVKLGLHWPYYWRYPSNISNAFEPSIFNSPLELENMSLKDVVARVTDLANGKTGGMLDFMSNSEATLNSYLNGVKWNVDHFFQGLFDKIKQQGMKNYVIVYTSDHGQNVLGHNPLSNAFDGAVSDENRITHCRDVDAPSENGEASVPMMIFTDNEELRARFARAAEHKVDKTTHFEIFPTLMELMGYDHALVKKMYGTSLLDEEVSNPQEYFTGSLFWRIKKNTFKK